MEEDLLSDLPLGIIHAILERVPIRDAVRTSVLSSQWKYKWATLPHLTFDDNIVSSSTTNLEYFIDQLLVLHHGPILYFKIDLQSPHIIYSMYQWLSFLSRNGIRMLSLCYAGKIPSSLYSCQYLTHLEISYLNLPSPPPTFKGFLCLKCLVLQYVDMPSDHTFQTLFAHLPLLEKMDLLTCLNEELKINASNLKILCLDCYVTEDVCIQAQLLRKMSIMLGNIPQKKGSVCKYTELLGGLTHLEELMGNKLFFKFLSFNIESCSGSLVFPLLRVIQITKGCEDEDEDDDNHWMKPIKSLLASSPVLETLTCYRLSLMNAYTLLKYPRASPNAKIFV